MSLSKVDYNKILNLISEYNHQNYEIYLSNKSLINFQNSNDNILKILQMKNYS